MIQDIYDLNPDGTLMVIGMSDNSIKGNYFGYNGEEGKPINEEPTEPSAVVTTIVDFIMSVGNGPMIKGEEKFGYTYVDTAGTTCGDAAAALATYFPAPVTTFATFGLDISFPAAPLTALAPGILPAYPAAVAAPDE